MSASSTALLFQVVENVEAESETYRRWWSERRVDGVLVVDPRLDDPRPRLLAELGRRIDAFHAATGAPSVTTDYSDEAGSRVTRELLSTAQPPTAIVYDNDIMAVAGVGAAAELGRRVPEDVSLVAWDDSPLCRLTHPMLTALVRDTHAFGQRAAQRLLAVIDGTANGDVEDELPQLSPRGSTSTNR